MKTKAFYCVFISFICVFQIAKAQNEEYKEPALPINNETKLITYSKVIETTANKDSLFRKGQQWFHTFYKNSTGVIRKENAANGKILGKHQIKVLNPTDKKGIKTMRGIVQYSVNTEFKDNKSRIVISEINLKAASYTPIEKWLDKTSQGFTPKNYYYLEQIDKQMYEVIADFEKFMKEPVKVKKDVW